MPKAFEKMKHAMMQQKIHQGMSKEMARKEATKEASMTWNKHMKGTGKTVGRGRK